MYLILQILEFILTNYFPVPDVEVMEKRAGKIINEFKNMVFPEGYDPTVFCQHFVLTERTGPFKMPICRYTGFRDIVMLSLNLSSDL